MNLINNLLLFGSCFGQTAGDAASDGTAQGGNSWWIIVIYIVIFAAIIYFLMIRPQRKERKKQEATMSSLEPGDSILTTSGFYGTLVAVNGDTVIVEFGNNKNCRIPMSKQAISQVEKANPTAAAPVQETNTKKFLGRNKKAEAEEAQAQAEAAAAKAEEAAAKAETVVEEAEEAAAQVEDAVKGE